MSTPVRTKDRGPPYLELELPERFEFQFFENGHWIGEAICLASHFTRNDDGSYVGSAGGSPIWFRCIAKHPEHFIHVDGTGALFVYRLRPVPLEEAE
jgi:hypothetical protein